MVATILGILGTLLQPFVGAIVAGIAAWIMKQQGQKQQAQADLITTQQAVITAAQARTQVDEQVQDSAPDVSGPDNPSGLHTTANDSGLSEWSVPTQPQSSAS